MGFGLGDLFCFSNGLAGGLSLGFGDTGSACTFGDAGAFGTCLLGDLDLPFGLGTEVGAKSLVGLRGGLGPKFGEAGGFGKTLLRILRTSGFPLV